MGAYVVIALDFETKLPSTQLSCPHHTFAHTYLSKHCSHGTLLLDVERDLRQSFLYICRIVEVDLHEVVLKLHDVIHTAIRRRARTHYNPTNYTRVHPTAMQ